MSLTRSLLGVIDSNDNHYDSRAICIFAKIMTQIFNFLVEQRMSNIGHFEKPDDSNEIIETKPIKLFKITHQVFNSHCNYKIN